MMKAIKIIKNDIHLGDIGATIQNHVEAEVFLLFKIFVVMVLDNNFIKNLMFYIMEKKAQAKK